MYNCSMGSKANFLEVEASIQTLVINMATFEERDLF